METLDRLLSLNYVRLSIPFFLLLIACEAWFSWQRRRELYHLADTINSLSCGILDQLMSVFVKSSLFGVYLFIHRHFALYDFTGLGFYTKLATALAIWLAVDFFYYWFHRLAHIVNIGWATHVAHHQSEEYNLATALRQGAFQGFFSFGFYLPLALVGVPPVWFLALSSLNTTYQFWIHTRLIKRLPWFIEAIFNTPSHHRVHHGSNARYIDKNHGGTFIIWDRLFGTFQAEDEEVVYGITTPLNSWNPLWAQVHYFVELWEQMRRTPRWMEKLQVLWRQPGWEAPSALAQGGLKPSAKAARLTPSAPPVLSSRQRWQSLGCFVVGLALGVVVLFMPQLAMAWRLIFTALAVLVLYKAGRLLETPGAAIVPSSVDEATLVKAPPARFLQAP